MDAVNIIIIISYLLHYGMKCIFTYMYFKDHISQMRIGHLFLSVFFELSHFFNRYL